VAVHSDTPTAAAAAKPANPSAFFWIFMDIQLLLGETTRDRSCLPGPSEWFPTSGIRSRSGSGWVSRM
jgi:hypothetical protein